LTSLDTIVELSNRAINLDPNYADAYASLGIATLMNFSFFGNKEVSISEVVNAEKYLKKARELDPYNLAANFGLALLNFWVKREYVEWEEFKEAFPNALNNRMIAGQIANFELEMGNYKEVLSIYEKDTAIDDTYIKANILSGNYRKAKKQIPILLAAAVQFSEMFAGEEYIWLQEFDSALYCLESGVDSSNMTIFSPRYMADMAVANFKTGNKDLARSIIGKLIEASDTTSVGSPAYFTGWYYGWIGEPDSAFYWLEKAYKNNSLELPWLKVDPAFTSLKDDPRYRDFYERTGHKAYDDYVARQNQ
jgi:tetratricopeptide (TPR) repeat protein